MLGRAVRLRFLKQLSASGVLQRRDWRRRSSSANGEVTFAFQHLKIFDSVKELMLQGQARPVPSPSHFRTRITTWKCLSS